MHGAAVHVGEVEGACAFNGKVDAALVGAQLPQHVDVADEVLKIERLILQLNGAVFDFAHLKDVVDEREQMVGRHFRLLAVLRGKLRVVGMQVADFQQADDAV